MSLDQFSEFLRDDLENLDGDGDGEEQIFAAQLSETLNNSGVTGDVLLLLDEEDRELTVFVTAEGLEPGQVVPQHIHGQLGNAESNLPTLEDDVDRDGILEVVEGASDYGPILLNLLTNADAAFDVPIGEIRADLPFPTADEDGNLAYRQTFRFDGDVDGDDDVDEDDENLADEIFAELLPLVNRHVVLHGLTLDEGQGETNDDSIAPNEADGTAGFKVALPVTNGEIFEVTTEFGLQMAVANLLCPDGEECDFDVEAFHSSVV